MAVIFYSINNSHFGRNRSVWYRIFWAIDEYQGPYILRVKIVYFHQRDRLFLIFEDRIQYFKPMTANFQPDKRQPIIFNRQDRMLYRSRYTEQD